MKKIGGAVLVIVILLAAGIAVVRGMTSSSARTIPTARVSVRYFHQFLMLAPVMNLIGASWGSSISLVSTAQMFEAWDLHQKKRPIREIAQRVWPAKFAKGEQSCAETNPARKLASWAIRQVQKWIDAAKTS